MHHCIEYVIHSARIESLLERTNTKLNDCTLSFDGKHHRPTTEPESVEQKNQFQMAPHEYYSSLKVAEIFIRFFGKSNLHTDILFHFITRRKWTNVRTPRFF